MKKIIFILALLAILWPHASQATQFTTKKAFIYTAIGIIACVALRHAYRWWQLREHTNTPYALHDACARSNLAQITLLLAGGVPINKKNSEGKTPLMLALDYQRYDIVTFLLEQGALVDLSDDESPLRSFWAKVKNMPANEQSIRILISLLAHSTADYMNTPVTKSGSTLLYDAAQRGWTDIVRFLLELKSPVNIRDNHDRTPLHGACVSGYRDIVELLLEYNADVMMLDQNHQMPLHRAALYGCYYAACLLLDHGAPVNVSDKKSQTPLHLAARYGHERLVKLLLEHHAEIDAQDCWHDTPLHNAVFANAALCVQYLLEHGASVALHNKRGQTPLHQTAYQCNTKIAHLLMDADAPLDITDYASNTPLHYAADSSKDYPNNFVQFMMCSSFFPPCWQTRPVHPYFSHHEFKRYTVPITLRELKNQCFVIFLQHLANVMALHGTPQGLPQILLEVIPKLGLWSYTVVAQAIPMKYQRAMIDAWRQHHIIDNIHQLLLAHYQRHLAGIQMLLAIKNSEDYTARDLADMHHKNTLVALFDHYTNAHEFSDLDVDLQKAIADTIGKKLRVKTLCQQV